MKYEEDKESLKKLRQELEWKQAEVDRMERAIENGRCVHCKEPLMYEERNSSHCFDFPFCLPEQPNK